MCQEALQCSHWVCTVYQGHVDQDGFYNLPSRHSLMCMYRKEGDIYKFFSQCFYIVFYYITKPSFESIYPRAVNLLNVVTLFVGFNYLFLNITYRFKLNRSSLTLSKKAKKDISQNALCFLVRLERNLVTHMHLKFIIILIKCMISQ